MDIYKKFAAEMARDAGEIMRKHFTVGVDRKLKADNSPVTAADLAINSLLIERVSKLFPDHSIFGEEESKIIEGSEYVWVCDPVDGTIPFSLGLPIATFSLALVKDGVPVLATVYDPFCDRLYEAELGMGAFLNGKKMQVSKEAQLDKATIEYENWNGSKYDIRALVNELERKGVGLLSFCSIVDPSMLVAAGPLQASIFPGSTAHDVAAIKIMVEEAGGKTSDIFGNEQRYDRPVNGFIASNGVLHDELVTLSKQFSKLR